MPEADALRLARRKFLAAQRIDMTALASELGVNRVTLYRWVGSRDALMVEVLWSLAAPTLAGADAAVRARGGERIVQVITRFLDAVITNAGMRRWLADEGELAMRLLTRHDTGFQPRLIGAVHGLLHHDLAHDMRAACRHVMRAHGVAPGTGVPGLSSVQVVTPFNIPATVAASSNRRPRPTEMP